MLGKKTNGAPSGPTLMLRAMGLDPAEIMGNIESAKQTATQVMQHFDGRLRAIEAQQTRMLELLETLAGGGPPRC